MDFVNFLSGCALRATHLISSSFTVIFQPVHSSWGEILAPPKSKVKLFQRGKDLCIALKARRDAGIITFPILACSLDLLISAFDQRVLLELWFLAGILKIPNGNFHPLVPERRAKSNSAQGWRASHQHPCPPQRFFSPKYSTGRRACKVLGTNTALSNSNPVECMYQWSIKGWKDGPQRTTALQHSI